MAAAFSDPHACFPPFTYGIPAGAVKAWRCPHCGRRWHLEYFRSEAGAYPGASWILGAQSFS